MASLRGEGSGQGTLIAPRVRPCLLMQMAVPGFRVSGKLYTATCPITMPFTGEVTVENADMKVKSIELQLVRVETCGTWLASTRACAQHCSHVDIRHGCGWGHAVCRMCGRLRP